MDEPTLAGWAEEFAAVHARLAPYFLRAEVRQRSAAYVRALLGSVERKNGRQLAEAIGAADPNGTQRLLSQAVWDEAAVRAELQAFVTEQFGDPAGIFVIDESGFLKKGDQSVGVQRPYSGTAGPVENCQIGVFLTDVSPPGHAFLERRLSLPKAWAADPDRRAPAQVPDGIGVQTKPELARLMLEHAWRQGGPGGWVTGDEVYGQDPRLTEALERAGRRYVLAVATPHPVWEARPALGVGRRGAPRLAADAPAATTVQAVVASWPATAPGPGSRSATAPKARAPTTGQRGGSWPPAISCPVQTAGCWRGAPAARPPTWPPIWRSRRRTPRWACWPGWPGRAGRSSNASKRPRARPGWITTRSVTGGVGSAISPAPWWPTPAWPVPAAPPPPPRPRAPRWGKNPTPASGRAADLIALPVPEVRRLLELTFPLPARSRAFRLAWSMWRRRHHARARRAH